MMNDLRTSIQVPKDTWNKLKEISWQEDFYMYEIIQALVHQYWCQFEYEKKELSNEYRENDKSLK